MSTNATNLFDIMTPVVSGIDALQYFAQSGAFYDRFYENLIQAVEDKKKYYANLNYQYSDDDIFIEINGIEVRYSGMGRDGFHWFYHDFFRCAFKDPEKSTNIHNIRIQVNAVGIYTLGLKSLLEYINKKFLHELHMNVFPITRIDLNAFVQHDFKYLRKEMILSKKKDHHANIAEHASAYELETYYVGKQPFLLRIYNKRNELKQATQIKRELMQNYFGIHGLDYEQPIFNVEFQMHREYLKGYGIDTVDQALERAETLFKHACDQIRLLDLSTISEDQINTHNRRRAETLPIWGHIKDSYSIKEFMQVETPLSKIEKITYRYSLTDAEKSIKKIITRLLIHQNLPTSKFLTEVLHKAQEEFQLRKHIKNKHAQYMEESKPKNELEKYSDEELWKMDEKLSKEMAVTSIDSSSYESLLHQYNALCDEMQRRSLVNIPF